MPIITRVRYRERPPEPEPKNIFAYQPAWPYINLGYGTERDYFIENMSLLVAAGVDIQKTLDILARSAKNRRFKQAIRAMAERVTLGNPLWQSLQDAKLLPNRFAYLVRIGEESGRLPEHLNLVTIQQHKERVFTSRLRTALLYPTMVLIISTIVAVVSIGYTLPKITGFLTQANVELPLTTRLLIDFGSFLEKYGALAFVIFIIGLGVIAYLFFIFKRTKFIGEAILFHTPGIAGLVQGVEVSRFGYMFGAMLTSGLVISDALGLLITATPFSRYKTFYTYLQKSVRDGIALETCFNDYRHADRLVPLPMLQLIASAERSGKLSETLLKVGQIFEEKTEALSRDLSTILEPLVLIVVGVIVGLIAVGIISPMYSLVGAIGI
jgi:type II secretory pathway component PulF